MVTGSKGLVSFCIDGVGAIRTISVGAGIGENTYGATAIPVPIIRLLPMRNAANKDLLLVLRATEYYWY